MRLKEQKKKESNCVRIFPMGIWETCCVCNRKFGFERGYTNSKSLSFVGKQYYVCNVCCEGSAQKADIIFDKTIEDFLNGKPNIPPPAPSKRLKPVESPRGNNDYIRRIT